jgi:DNA modification methylase
MTDLILVGDALERLRELPDCSVHMCVTSPPYFGLRSYLRDDHPDKPLEMGLEETPDDYIARMVVLFRDVRRVLRDDGTLWLNIGDSYASTGGHGPQCGEIFATRKRGVEHITRAARYSGGGIKPKDLIGIPWMLAFALRGDGWFLRQEIIWGKRNTMPESVRDRCTKAHEQIFLLTKRPKYFFDSEAIKEPMASSSLTRLSQDVAKQHGTTRANGGRKTNGNMKAEGDLNTGMRNKRSVWFVGTKPFKEAHFATFPPDLIEPCILAGTSAAGVCVCVAEIRGNALSSANRW